MLYGLVRDLQSVSTFASVAIIWSWGSLSTLFLQTPWRCILVDFPTVREGAIGSLLGDLADLADL